MTFDVLMAYRAGNLGEGFKNAVSPFCESGWRCQAEQSVFMTAGRA